MNPKLLELFDKIISNKEILEELLEIKNINILYKRCVSVISGYTIEEFKVFLKKIVESYSKTKEVITDNDLIDVSGGTKYRNLLTSLGVATVLVSQSPNLPKNDYSYEISDVSISMLADLSLQKK
ncbi:MAG: hypothetical protein RsTaC01_0326 [Candidatus Paraimprobicoccus trichonymphae]|uniref:Uncharacterized protein n=1 Tax=Candidatus Paraimprobicoccus trichonymphae TaxID=3033793 RepID=A0AA48I5P0_9FIRM|nr:MAG: hypothetical protein RsTaC01_0326 [Candidatus Paraimprobicoccus trichonymphae]